MSNPILEDIIRNFTACKFTGVHSWVKSEKEGTMVCKYCGIFAKVGAMYLTTGDDQYLKIGDQK